MHWTRLQKAALIINLVIGVIIVLGGLFGFLSQDATTIGVLIMVLLTIVAMVRGKFWGL
ncbi:hypothetical protein L1O03_01300 [Corynebacterium uropygiale]|uniref:Uncharacterized protein n=1 Tax=Corynebacterium uropygiale TaxID=1775911 RepID=A0A9X1QPI3_9CORY|nr:hypothetical protein [Corynebacterium uropygiale]MCF4005815.1 hypothetical protein [Corynebacterium uropygiale]